jgi:hypothetical protein
VGVYRKIKFRGIIMSMGSLCVNGNTVHIRETCVFVGSV